MDKGNEQIVFVEVDSASRDYEHTAYYGNLVQFDPVAFVKDPAGATLAFQATIKEAISRLQAGQAGRAGMELESDPVQVFKFVDLDTGKLVVAWRVVCRQHEPEQIH